MEPEDDDNFSLCKFKVLGNLFDVVVVDILVSSSAVSCCFVKAVDSVAVASANAFSSSSFCGTGGELLYDVVFSCVLFFEHFNSFIGASSMVQYKYGFTSGLLRTSLLLARHW